MAADEARLERQEVPLGPRRGEYVPHRQVDPFRDLREAEDPEALTVARATHKSDRPGKVRKGRNLVPDLGSIKTYNPQVAGSGSASASSTADWVKIVNRVDESMATTRRPASRKRATKADRSLDVPFQPCTITTVGPPPCQT